MLSSCYLWRHKKGRMRGEVGKGTPQKELDFYDVTRNILAAFSAFPFVKNYLSIFLCIIYLLLYKKGLEKY